MRPSICGLGHWNRVSDPLRMQGIEEIVQVRRPSRGLEALSKLELCVQSPSVPTALICASTKPLRRTRRRRFPQLALPPPRIPRGSLRFARFRYAGRTLHRVFVKYLTGCQSISVSSVIAKYQFVQTLVGVCRVDLILATSQTFLAV